MLYNIGHGTKEQIASYTGLSQGQVAHWLINKLKDSILRFNFRRFNMDIFVNNKFWKKWN